MTLQQSETTEPELELSCLGPKLTTYFTLIFFLPDDPRKKKTNNDQFNYSINIYCAYILCHLV